MLKYHHSMLASYELSIHRLRRNIKHIVWHDKLEEYCVVLLQLLSAMNLHEISEHNFSEFKSALRKALQNLRGNVRRAEFSDVVVEPRRLNHEISVDECVTELVKGLFANETRWHSLAQQRDKSLRTLNFDEPFF